MSRVGTIRTLALLWAVVCALPVPGAHLSRCLEVYEEIGGVQPLTLLRRNGRDGDHYVRLAQIAEELLLQLHRSGDTVPTLAEAAARAGIPESVVEPFLREVTEFFDRYQDVAPEYRPMDELARSLRIPPRDAWVVALYFGRESGLEATSGRGFEIWATVARDARRRETLARRLYYERNLTRKTVQEMAHELRAEDPNVTELGIYNELSALDISIDGVWRRPLSALDREGLDRRLRAAGRDPHDYPPNVSLYAVAEDLHIDGVAIPRIAQILGVGEQSLRNIFHYNDREWTGIPWTKAEVEFVEENYGELPVRYLAQVLGRTEASIASRARDMNLTGTVTLGRPDVTLPGYGPIKQGGLLQRDLLEAYLWDHPNESHTALAEALDVSRSTIMNWRRRLGIVPARLQLANRDGAPDNPLARRRLEGYESQHAFLDAALDELGRTGRAVERNPDMFPLQVDFWQIFQGRVLERVQALELRALRGPLLPEEAQALRNYQNFTVHRAPLDRRPLTARMRRLLDEQRPAARASALRRAMEYLEATGEHTSFANAIESTGHNFSVLLGHGHFAPGEPMEARRLFDSPGAFWEAFEHERQLRVRELRGRRELTALELVTLRNLESFNPFKIIMAKQGEEYTPEYVRLLDGYRPELQRRTIAEHLGQFGRTGIFPLVFGEGETSRIFGNRVYRPGVAERHRRVFDSKAHYFVAFEGARRTRIAELEQADRSRRLSDEEIRELRNLRAFSLFDIDWNTAERAEAPAELATLFEAHRTARKERYVREALEYLERSGNRITNSTAQEVLGIHPQILFAQSSYSPGSENHWRRVFDQPSDFWTAFEAGRQERLAALRRQRDGMHVPSPDVAQRLARLESHDPRRVPTGDREERREGETRSPATRESAVQDAVELFLTTGALLDRNSALRVTASGWDRLVGEGRYAPEKERAAMALFRSPEAWWIEVDREIDVRLARLEALAARRPLTEEEASLLNRLREFSLGGIHEITPALVPLVDKQRARVKGRLVARVLDRFTQTGIAPRGPELEELTGFRVRQLFGQELYDKETGRLKDRRLFDSVAEFWDAFETARRARVTALQGRNEEGARRELATLETFSIFDVVIQERDDGGAIPPLLVALYDAHRVRERERIVARTLAHYATGGELLTSTNGARVAGLSQTQLAGTGMWHPETGPWAYRRVFDRSADYWVAFERARNAERRRLAEQETAEGTLSEADRARLARLDSFSIFDVSVRDASESSPELLAIYEAHRPARQAVPLLRAVEALETRGVMVTAVTVVEVTGFKHSQLMGYSEFGPDGRSYLRRIYDSPLAFWTAFEAAKAQRETALRARLEDGALGDGERADVMARLARWESYRRPRIR